MKCPFKQSTKISIRSSRFLRKWPRIRPYVQLYLITARNRLRQDATGIATFLLLPKPQTTLCLSLPAPFSIHTPSPKLAATSAWLSAQLGFTLTTLSVSVLTRWSHLLTTIDVCLTSRPFTPYRILLPIPHCSPPHTLHFPYNLFNARPPLKPFPLGPHFSCSGSE